MRQVAIRFKNIEIDRSKLKIHVRPDPLVKLSRDMVEIFTQMTPAELYDTLSLEPGGPSGFRMRKPRLPPIASEDYSLILMRGSSSGIEMLHYEEAKKELIIYYQFENDHSTSVYKHDCFSILEGFKGLPDDIRDLADVLYTNDVDWKVTKKYLRYTDHRIGQEAVIERLRSLTVRELPYLMIQESREPDLRDAISHWLGQPKVTEVHNYLKSIVGTCENIARGNVI